MWLCSGICNTEFFHWTDWKKVKVFIAQSCSTLCDPMDTEPARLLCPWDSPGKNTGMGSHSLLQGIFPIQRSNPGLLHCRHITAWATTIIKVYGSTQSPFPWCGVGLPHVTQVVLLKDFIPWLTGITGKVVSTYKLVMIRTTGPNVVICMKSLLFSTRHQQNAHKRVLCSVSCRMLHQQNCMSVPSSFWGAYTIWWPQIKLQISVRIIPPKHLSAR